MLSKGKKIEGMERYGRRRKQLPNNLKETRSWKLKEKALDRTFWKTHFGRSYGLSSDRTRDGYDDDGDDDNDISF